jgi:pilus assembly protein CpaC
MVNGTSVPSLLTRRVETTLEMQSGQTFAIAGLISRNDQATTDRVPGLGDLPVLGSLFRSVRYTRSDTELLVLVTASLVEPTSTEANPLVPGMLHEAPNDWEFYWEGRTGSKDHPRLAPAQAESLKRLGLNNLRGPGGWATYEKTPDKLAGDGIAGH